MLAGPAGGVGEVSTVRAHALAAVDRIVADLSDRRGLRQEWEGIDSGIRAEIQNEWRAIIEREIVAALAGVGTP